MRAVEVGDYVFLRGNRAVEKGKVAEFWISFDAIGLIRQLGIALPIGLAAMAAEGWRPSVPGKTPTA